MTVRFCRTYTQVFNEMEDSFLFITSFILMIDWSWKEFGCKAQSYRKDPTTHTSLDRLSSDENKTSLSEQHMKSSARFPMKRGCTKSNSPNLIRNWCWFFSRFSSETRVWIIFLRKYKLILPSLSKCLCFLIIKHKKFLNKCIVFLDFKHPESFLLFTWLRYRVPWYYISEPLQVL